MSVCKLNKGFIFQKLQEKCSIFLGKNDIYPCPAFGKKGGVPVASGIFRAIPPLSDPVQMPYGEPGLQVLFFFLQ